ncbi:MAG: low affinity iron permease family protein [bacterium]
MANTNVPDLFRVIAKSVGEAAGSAKVFVVAVVIIAIWALLGRHFHYSDTWQLVINTGTTIVTFLMVFLIQNMQNRDSKATQLKLDELIRAMKGARNKMMDLEDMSDREISEFITEFKKRKLRADRKPLARSRRRIA